MNRRILFLLVAMTSLVVALFGAGVASADPGPNADDNAATIHRGVGCVVSSSASGLPVFLFTNQMTEVDTNSGNTVLKCTFDIPAGLEPATAIVNTGFGCGTLAGGTSNTRSVATPGGKVFLTCQINGSN